MSGLSVPVAHYMTAPVHTVHPDVDLVTAQTRLSGLTISSLAVVDGKRLRGVISMTDLIRVGRRQTETGRRTQLLSLPDMSVRKLMSQNVAVVGPADTVAAAAERMVHGRFHRVYVQEHGALVGVLSTMDIMLAIQDKRMKDPISQWMSSPAFTVRATEPISMAVERLEKAHISGLIVVDDGWPVGLFTQREALESRDESGDTRVEHVMNPAMLALDVGTPLHRAAAQAAALRVRRVIAVKHRSIEGILTGIDFARAAV